MIRGRSILGLVTIVFVLLGQLPIAGPDGCSMCGASCRCASRVSSSSCSVRSIGCGGEERGATVGSSGPLRAVLFASGVVMPQTLASTAPAAAPRLPKNLARPPLDRPPRVSC